MPKTVINLDAELIDEFGPRKSIEDFEVVTINLFDEEIRIVKTVNILNLLSIGQDGDTGAIVTALTNFVHPDDRRAFKNAYARQLSISGDELLKILTRVLEVAADDNPTGSSSASRRTTPRKTAKASLEPKLRLHGQRIEHLTIGEWCDIAWMLLMRDAPALMNPHEYRTKMYEIFYKGDSPSSTPRRGRPVADRDNATLSDGKAELEALMASKGFGGDKLGIEIGGGRSLTVDGDEG